MKIILAGGGTGGPAIPLLAVAEELKKTQPNTEFLFVGTKTGPECLLVGQAGIKFVAIPAGKFRRYFSFKNVSDFFRTIAGYSAAKKIIRQFQPDLVISAGSFVGVPVGFAAKSLKIPILVHQQDARIGLANKLIAPFAAYISTALPQTAQEFPTSIPTTWVGNPVREEFLNNMVANKDFFHLVPDLPVLLVVGGATGATQINDVMAQALPELVKAHQVIHLTGKGKNYISFSDPNYHPYELLTKEFPDAMKLADIVVARAGLSTIAELSALGKVSIVVPIPGTHQEDNAAILKQANAAIVLGRDEFTPEILARLVIMLKFNRQRCDMMAQNIKKLMPHDAAEHLAKIIIEKFDHGK